MLMHEGRVAITDSLSVNDYDLVTVRGYSYRRRRWRDHCWDRRRRADVCRPEGAGARPGAGGIWIRWHAADCTDAHLVLGRMRPGPYAGGSVSLDMSLAEQALDTEIATPAGISRTEAAAGLIRIVEQNLLHASNGSVFSAATTPGVSC